MDSIRLVNLRSMVDSGPVRIAPITLLVGQNSSGKSTFARFLPLLRQTSEVLAREPLLWFGRFVDFGSVEEATSRIGGTGGLGFDVTYSVDKATIASRRRGLFSYRAPQTRGSTPVTMAVRYLGGGEYEFTLTVLESEVQLHISDLSVAELRINGVDYTDMTQGKLAVSTWSSCFPNLVFRDESAPDSDPFARQIVAFARANTHGKSQADRVAHLARSVMHAPLDNVLASVTNPGGADSIWHRTTQYWTPQNPTFRKLRDWIVGTRLPELFQIAGSAFNSRCSQVRYITPIRASAERYYRRQGLALGEIDPQGQNVAMFLHNLSSMEKQRFMAWMGDHFGYAVDTVATSGHVSMVIRDLNDQAGRASFNLADTGFGFSQLIPVLIQIWTLLNPRGLLKSAAAITPIIAIEQPELHLHPRLQAVLADLFAQAVKVAHASGLDLRLVVETHSEQIINRLGRRVSEGTVGTEDVAVVLFDKPNFSEPTTVKATKFDADGYLTDWPYGFFEARD
jgi:predicted ATPase